MNYFSYIFITIPINISVDMNKSVLYTKLYPWHTKLLGGVDMKYPKFKTDEYYEIIGNYKEAQLFFSAIKLDIFSFLDSYRSSEEVAKLSGYDKRNMKFYLNAITSMGLIEKKEEKYRNTESTDYYLNSKSSNYIGEVILFREEWTSLDNIEYRLKNGSSEDIVRDNDGNKVYEFKRLAELSGIEMYTGRVQSFLSDIEKIIRNNPIKKVLDLGGGSGVMAIEIVKEYENAKATIFEHPNVAEVPLKFIKKEGLENRINVEIGNFNEDDIGEGYDLIIASGIMDFSNNNPEKLLKKIYGALNPNGILYVITHKVNDEYTAPKPFIIGWLSSHLEGLDLLLTDSEINNAIETAGFCRQEIDTFGDIYLK